MIGNILKSVIFGIIEGITEWLPISSTGHLILAEQFLKFTNVSANFWDVFEVVIQLGAILAVIVLYFKNIWPFKIEKEKHGSGSKFKCDKSIFDLWAKIIVSCLPAVAIVALKIDDYAEAHFYNPICISIMLILVGILFIIIENKNEKDGKKARVNSISELTFKDAITIGIFQVIAAIFPGTSRSGATIIGALLIGVSRIVSAEYTFYLAIPAMLGASVLKIAKYGLGSSSAELMILAIGTIVAFAVSMFIIKFLMNYIKKHDFKVFGWYRIALGILVIVLSLVNVI